MRRVSIQEPPPILHTRRVSIQEPSSILRTRRASIQEPSSILRTRRASVQEPSPIDNSLWGSIREAPSLGNISQKSIQETPSTVNISQTSIQQTPSVSSVHQAGPQDTPPVPPLNTLTVLPSVQTSSQIRRFSIPRPSLIPHVPHTSQTSLGDNLTSTQSQSLKVPGIKFPNRASVDVPPSITDSPEASVESMESILWVSQEAFKESLYNLQVSKNSPDSDIPLHSSMDTSSGRFHFLHELCEFLVHPGTPGHLDLEHGNGPPSFLLPQLPATGLTTLLSGPHTHHNSCPFSVPSESPPLKLLIGIFKSVLLARICFWLS
ncbi:uncharacterized protein LOC111824464 isoform X2 [Myotis lucifugus]|uniref:uncharacterized protein LOC111824464 isoform X2 n=1 Tax=Myotis lucifugus TaxID=59463 RepID=UPI000CCC63B8|nr:uncharacterized protein LOC111824464 isoform X2 [Myotis lucifugus]